MRAGHTPLEVLGQAKSFGIESVILGVSGGKDSVVCLDLCTRHFKTVRPYFMYVVPGISFQERYLAYLERRFSVSIERVPHWMLTNAMRCGVFRHETEASRKIRRCRLHHFATWIRQRTGLNWLVGGEKASDSLERNASMVRDGAIQAARGRLFPLAWWSTSDVESHLARERIVMPPDYRLNAESDPALRRRRGASFGGLIVMQEALKIAEHFPQDYELIRKFYPFIDVQLQRWRQLNERGLVGGEKNEAGDEQSGRAGGAKSGGTDEPEAEAGLATEGAGPAAHEHD